MSTQELAAKPHATPSTEAFATKLHRAVLSNAALSHGADLPQASVWTRPKSNRVIAVKQQISP